jgi:peptidoglycan/LPS O-acetylase OafA/YrhL
MRHIPALDGLRAVAIVMVISYHVDKTIVPAGYWGVILFFVLSGYLITRMLIDEVDRHGQLDLRFFYVKRGLRLFPALAVLCLVLLAAGIGWSQVGPAIAHYANYARIAEIDLGLLTHTWFLAVMAHFYLLWPLVIASVPAGYRRRAIGILAVAAIAWRVIAIETVSPGWVYNATDTNAAALLAGCYLGVARPRTSWLAHWSVPALLVLMLFPVFGEEGSAFLWGDFIAIALSVMAIQYAVSRPAWLENGILLWVGEISYGLYLWHYVFVNIEMAVWVAVPLSVAAAAASWYLIEKPPLSLSKRFDRRAEQSDREPRPPARADRDIVTAPATRHS